VWLRNGFVSVRVKPARGAAVNPHTHWLSET
jgi:hypothetical protein